MAKTQNLIIEMKSFLLTLFEVKYLWMFLLADHLSKAFWPYIVSVLYDVSQYQSLYKTYNKMLYIRWLIVAWWLFVYFNEFVLLISIRLINAATCHCCV